MRGIFVLLMLSFVSSACIINPARDRPVRSTATFLRDVKIVVDSGDLGNVGFVGHQLRIVCDSGSREPVRDRAGAIKGYGVDVKCTASSKEYEKERNFNYGLFWPDGMNFYRAGLSLSINGEAMCITPFDLIEAFGDVEKYSVSHWGSWSYMYKRSDINSMAVFSIDRNGCVGGVYVSLNRERVR
ncbi:hypothetical protein [Burkholderia cenocepacia]|uniref:hypothetical protein n=1 Tax=Burkholderia cenocepacia TaxID=95486 RepID=UPI00158A9A6F|nr:hypothetical protein [Burkholderia cenocepacia]